MKNIIADFTSKKCSTLKLKGLTQWDYGRVLEVRLENMPRTFEAHFSYNGFEDSLVVEVAPESDVAIVPIPNIITTQDKDATCWIYYENETSGATYKTIILPITPRTKPSDYVYTETEVFTYKKLKEELEAKIATAGRVKTVNGIEPDDAGNITVEVAGGFSGEYNDLKGKTHYDTRESLEILNESILFEGQMNGYIGTVIENATLNEVLLNNVGRSINVTFNKGNYNCAIKKFVYMGGMDICYIGSDEALASFGFPVETEIESKEPFCFVLIPNSPITAMFKSDDNSATVDVIMTFEEGELKQLDEQFIPDSVSRADHVHSYNDLTDKTHYDTRESEEIIIEWDGDTSDKIVVYNNYYKVSDVILTNEQIKNGAVTMCDGREIEISPIWSNFEQMGLVTDDFCVLEAIIITRKDNVAISNGDSSITVEEAGVYFAYLSFDEFDYIMYPTSLKCTQSSGELKQLDEKYIPSTLSRLGHTHNWNDLEDKPFCEVPKNILICEYTCNEPYTNGIQDAQTEHSTGLGSCWKIGYLPEAEYILGDEYMVTVNGTGYNATLKKCYTDSSAVYFVGLGISENDSFNSPDADGNIPFVCYFDVDANPTKGAKCKGEMYFLLRQDTETFSETTIQIYHKESEIYSLHGKFIKDMYYDDSTMNEVVSETELEGFDVLDDGVYAVTDAISMTPTVGATYTVVWDGTEYSSTCDSLAGMMFIGNTKHLFADVNYDNGMPFLIAFSDETFVVTNSDAYSHTIRVIECIDGLKQIDEKYIPNSIARKSDIKSSETHYDTRVFETIEVEKPLTFDGLENCKEYAAIQEGVEIYYCKISDHVYTPEELINATVTFNIAGQPHEEVITEELIVDMEPNGYPMVSIGEFLIVAKDDFVFPVYNINFTKGTWTLYIGETLGSKHAYLASTSLTHVVKEPTGKVLSGDFKPLDDKFISEYVAKQIDSHTHSYNNLTDRTHYSEITEGLHFTWDGKTEWLVTDTHSFTFNGEEKSCIKVSKDIPIKKELQHVSGIIRYREGSNRGDHEFNIKMSDFIEENGYIYTSSELLGIESDVVVYLFIIQTKEAANSFGLAKPGIYASYETGTYTGGSSINYYFTEINIDTVEDILRLDEKFLPDSVKVQPDWNQNDETAPDYIKNKPFYDNRTYEEVEVERPITFDGVLEGKEYVRVNDTAYLVKVSDSVYTYDEVIGETIMMAGHINGQFVSASQTIDELRVRELKNLNEQVVGIAVAEFIFSINDIFEDGDVILTKGTWFQYVSSELGVTYMSQLSLTHTVKETVVSGTLKQIDDKFLSDNVVKKAGLPEKLSDLKNDLYYDQDDLVLTLTSNDFIFDETYNAYIYTGTPMWDWVTSKDCLWYRLIVSNGDTGANMVIDPDMLPFDYKYYDNGRFNADASLFTISNGYNPHTESMEDIHMITFYNDISNMGSSISVEIYKRDIVKIPAKYLTFDEQYIPDTIARKEDIKNISSFVLLSPNGTKFSITVDDDGTIKSEKITE